MAKAVFRFHGALNDFLPEVRHNSPFEHIFDWRASIKDMIESLGPPHCEIHQIIVNGLPVDFDYIVQPGDTIHVYDLASAIHLSEKVHLRSPLVRRPRFVLDTHLGRLASYLRMLGFDSLYRNDFDDDELAQISNRQNRILLTRDIGLLKRSLVIYGYFIRCRQPKDQIVEVLERFDLRDSLQPFRHCMKCNGMVTPVEKQVINGELPENVSEQYQEFRQCADCGRVYWKGSHYTRMQKFLEDVLAADRINGR